MVLVLTPPVGRGWLKVVHGNMPSKGM